MKPTKEVETSFQGVQECVEDWLNEYGYESSQERELPPFVADIFLDKEKIDIECDSVYHYPKRDKKRDEYLFDTYGVRTFRIDYDDIIACNKEKIMLKFEEWLNESNKG